MRGLGIASLGVAAVALLGGCVSSEGSSCEFADPSLAAAVVNEANFSGVPQSEVVVVVAPGTTNLQGVQCLRRLETLDVVGGPIADLSPLRGNSTLETLIVETTATEVVSLGTLPHLSSLTIFGP